MGFDFAFTVLTPVYNRAHTLSRVYERLKAQTFRNFEWLVVDDSSTDSTAQLLAGWLCFFHPLPELAQPGQARGFQPGGGRGPGRDVSHPGLRPRLPAPGPRTLAAPLAGHPSKNSPEVSGGQRPLPAPILDISALELRHGFCHQSELWGFTSTLVLSGFPYPEPPNARFVYKDLVWSPITARYLTRFVDERLRVYHTEGHDRLIGSGVPESHLPGLMLWHQVMLNLEMPWLSRHPAYFLRSTLNYAHFARG
ncbi:Glycosyltransferase [Desulfarculales bacterium]